MILPPATIEALAPFSRRILATLQNPVMAAIMRGVTPFGSLVDVDRPSPSLREGCGEEAALARTALCGSLAGPRGHFCNFWCRGGEDNAGMLPFRSRKSWWRRAGTAVGCGAGCGVIVNRDVEAVLFFAACKNLAKTTPTTNVHVKACKYDLELPILLYSSQVFKV